MRATSFITNRSFELNGLNNKFDFIISTIPASYDPLMYVRMLKEGGELAIVGQPAADKGPKISVSSLPFFAYRKI